MFDVQVIEESNIYKYFFMHVLRELAEWFIAISLKLILVKSTNIRSNRIFSDDNTILLRRPTKAKKPTFA